MLDDFSENDGPQDAPRRSRKSRKKWGAGRRTLAVLLCIVVLLALGVGGYGWFINSKIDNNLERENLLGDSGGRTTTTAGKELVDDAGTNYLLIGSDARPGEGASRADVIQLIHVDEDYSDVWMIHFPRDLYVPVPGHGEDKINAAYAYGQSPLLVQTVEDLVGVKIDHVAKTDFEGFVGITKALGGVTVNNNQGSKQFPEGQVELKGSEALDYVHERKTLQEGDISRGERQQSWLKGIMGETLSPSVVLNPRRFGNVVEAGTSHTIVDQDLTTAKIRREALRLRSVRGADIHYVTAPFSGYGTSPSGASIDVLDEQGMKELSKALRNDTMADYAS